MSKFESVDRYFYHSSIHKPTAVSACDSGYFTSSDRLNLVLSKMSHIEIHNIGPSGLTKSRTHVVNGNVIYMKLFRPTCPSVAGSPSVDTDLLLFITSRNDIVVLKCDRVDDNMETDSIEDNFKLRTIANGSLEERFGQKREDGIICSVDPHRAIIVHLYNAVIKVIPIHDLLQNISRSSTTSTELVAFNLRIDEMQLLDMTTLYTPTSNPFVTLALLAKKSTPVMNVYRIDLDARDFIAEQSANSGQASTSTTNDAAKNRQRFNSSVPLYCHLHRDNLDAECSMLAPVALPYGGVLIFASTVYYDPCQATSEPPKRIPKTAVSGAKDEDKDGRDVVPQTLLSVRPDLKRISMITAWCQIDTGRYLLGDRLGRLFVVVAVDENGQPASKAVGPLSNRRSARKDARIETIAGLKMDMLGETNIPHCMCYLDARVIFVGSRIGESQVLRITDEPVNMPLMGNNDQSTAKEYPNYVEVLDTFLNTGPILDMALIDTSPATAGFEGDSYTAAPLLVTCSNAFKNGTLRFIRSGVGVRQLAMSDFEELLKVVFTFSWHAPSIVDKSMHNSLVVCTNDGTRLVNIDDDGELSMNESYSEQGFDVDNETLLLMDLSVGEHLSKEHGSFVLQITSNNVHAWSFDRKLDYLWSCSEVDNKTTITKAHVLKIESQGSYLIAICCTNELCVLKLVLHGDNAGITKLCQHSLPNEIACVCIASEVPPKTSSSVENENVIVCVGLWQRMCVNIYRLNDIVKANDITSLTQTMHLGGGLPRSICISHFVDDHDLNMVTTFLLVSLADGSLLNCTLSDALSKHQASTATSTRSRTTEAVTSLFKRVVLGVRPLTLCETMVGGKMTVFAMSDRTAIMHASHGKLVFSNVNLTTVTGGSAVSDGFATSNEASAYVSDPSSSRTTTTTNMVSLSFKSVASLNCAAYPDCVVLATAQGAVKFGSIEKLQRLHIQTFPLKESPRRITVQNATNTFAVVSIRYDDDLDETLQRGVSTLCPSKSGYVAKNTSGDAQSVTTPSSAALLKTASDHQMSDDEAEIHSVLVFDSVTCELVHCHSFEPREEVTAITSVQFDSDDANVSFYAVGVTYVVPNQQEPRSGRILLLRWMEGKLTKVCEFATKGAVFSLNAMSGRLLATVNATTLVLDYSNVNSTPMLTADVAAIGEIMSLYSSVFKDYVAVGDIMRSVTLLKWNHGQLLPVAGDCHPMWLMALQMVDDDCILAAEFDNNLFCCQTTPKPVDAKSQSGSSSSNGAAADGETGAGTAAAADEPSVTTRSTAQASQSQQQSAKYPADSRAKMLRTTARYHLGETVNVFRKGCLAMRNIWAIELSASPDDMDTNETKKSSVVSQPVLYGSIEGTVGLIFQMSKPVFALLSYLESSLADSINAIGSLDHNDWRSYSLTQTYQQKQPGAVNVVDGDFLQQLVEIDDATRETILSALPEALLREAKVSKEGVCRLIEDLGHLH